MSESSPKKRARSPGQEPLDEKLPSSGQDLDEGMPSSGLPPLVREFISKCTSSALLEQVQSAVFGRLDALKAQRECARIQHECELNGFAISLGDREIKGLDSIGLALMVSLLTWDKEDMSIEHTKCTGLSSVQQEWVAALEIGPSELESEIGFDSDTVDLHGIDNWPDESEWEAGDWDDPYRCHKAEISCRLYFPVRGSGLGPGVYKVVCEASGEKDDGKVEKLTVLPDGKLEFESRDTWTPGEVVPGGETECPRFFVLPSAVAGPLGAGRD